MQKIVFIFFLSLVFSLTNTAIGQNETRAKQRDMFDGQPKAKVVIVPYEGKMLISDINRELGSKHKMTLPEIKNVLREGLCQMVAMEGSREFEMLDMINSGEKAVYQDIQYIFNSLGYQYTKVPQKTEEEKEQNLLEKAAEKVDETNEPSQKGRGAYVEEGEVKTEYDDKERYMDASILRPSIFEYLEEKYEADYFFFITQLDIKVMRTPEMPEWTTAERRLKMHYTIFNGKGEKVAGSASYAYFRPEEKNIFNIVKNYFPELAKSAVADIPVAEESDNDNKDEPAPKEENKQSPATRISDDDDNDF